MHILDENKINNATTEAQGNLGLEWTDTKVCSVLFLAYLRKSGLPTYTVKTFPAIVCVFQEFDFTTEIKIRIHAWKYLRISQCIISSFWNCINLRKDILAKTTNECDNELSEDTFHQNIEWHLDDILLSNEFIYTIDTHLDSL